MTPAAVHTAQQWPAACVSFPHFYCAQKPICLLNVPVITYLLTFWRPLVLVLAPALFSLVFLHAEEDDEAAVKCAYVLLVMATFWMTEVLPVAITALIPVAAFPLMGVMSTVFLLDSPGCLCLGIVWYTVGVFFLSFCRKTLPSTT